jgi:hypothetical protein
MVRRTRLNVTFNVSLFDPVLLGVVNSVVWLQPHYRINHTGVFKFIILTTVNLASSNNALPDDGVIAPKHVGAVLMSILKLFLRQFTCASVGE